MDDGSSDDHRQHDNELIDLLLSNESVDGFLSELVKFAGQATEHSCSITVRTSPGVPFTIATTDVRTQELDEQQYLYRTGPCLQALTTGVPVFVIDMRSESRWPPYPGEAARLGALSSMSYPLINGEDVLGALNLYATEPLTPDTRMQARAAQLADRAAGAVAVALRLADRTAESENLRIALTSRSVIDQAIGILMGQQHCSAEAAFELLRQTSQRRNLKLHEVAAQIVGGVVRKAPGGQRGRY
jgi:transcriptional regulator with GAF, ATPase, and Fis domain